MIFKIGTRASKLALAQAEEVKSKLEDLYPLNTFELQPVSTTADRLSQVPMREISAAGMFVRELEEELFNGSIDLAVHSMKDLPSEQPEGLLTVTFGDREDPRDVLLLASAASLNDLREGAVIGTGSLRRKYQLLRLRPDLEIVDIRGNIETRIRKMDEGQVDGLVLAAAGIRRLGLENRITKYFHFDEMIPAPAQGALALEFREDRPDISGLIAPLTDGDTDETVAAERGFLKLMDCGCRQPVGAVAEKAGDLIHLKAMYGDEQGEHIQFADVQGKDPNGAAKMAARQFGEMRKQGYVR